MSQYNQKKNFQNKPIPVTALKERKLALTNYDKERGVSWDLKFEYIFGGVHLIATGFPTQKDSGIKPINIRARFDLRSAQTMLTLVEDMALAAKSGVEKEPYRAETYKDNPDNKREKVLEAIVVVGYDSNGVYIGLNSAKDPEQKRRFYINSGQYVIWSAGSTPLSRFQDSVNASFGWVNTFRNLLSVVVGVTVETPPHQEAYQANKSTGNATSTSYSTPPSSTSEYDDY
jgi:hypothetical protein